MAANGRNNIIPAIPQTDAPINNLKIATKGLTFKLLPTIFGLKKLLSIVCIPQNKAITATGTHKESEDINA